MRCRTVVPLCYDCDQLNGYNINCTVCFFGWYPINATLCVPCYNVVANCSRCTPDFNGSASCYLCNDTMYTPNGSVCLSCTTVDPNCYFCNNQGQCTQCLLDYYVNSNFTCTRKPNCTVENCLQCSNTDGTVCVRCKNLFTLTMNNTFCQTPTCTKSG